MRPRWMSVSLNTSDQDLIYETPGDAERGDPLDIITVATAYGGKDVTGFKIPTKPFTLELAMRWNAHAALLAGFREMLADLEREYGSGVANGYWPDMKPKLERWRATLKTLE